MANLFKKAAICTDLHLGLKSNSITHLEDCTNYINWFIKTAHKHNCDICLFLGDFFNNRNHINLVTLNYGIRCLRLLSDAFPRTIMIPGNHDLFYKDNRTISSIEFAKHIPNVEIFNEWHKEGDVIFVPWLVKNEHKKIANANAKYMMGHFELPNFLMNQMVRMPDVGELHAEHFDNFGEVFSGHFHKRQQQKNITYIGNAFPHNYSDAWDDDRGMMILEWGKPKEYIYWPDSPKYRTVKLSQLMTDPAAYLHENSYVKLTLDNDVSYEEANYLKETLAEEYKLREISLISSKSDTLSDDLTSSDVSFQTVDQIVMESINNIDSEFYDSKLLLQIYKNI